MEPINRRTFLKRGSAVVAAAGAAAVIPGQIAGAATHALGRTSAERITAPDAMTDEFGVETTDEVVIAHVRNFDSGEIALFSGDREVVVHDRSLTSRIARVSKGSR